MAAQTMAATWCPAAMGESTKRRYEIDLTTPVVVGGVEGASVRPIAHDDLDSLARLMIDAYVGTIDYEDEDYDDAVEEVRGYLDGDPLLENSYLAEVAGEVASAVLVELVDGAPFIGYVMTVTACKGSGLARLVTTTAMSSLASDGYSKVAFYITVGNKPSEALFKSVGAIPAAG